MKIANIVLYTNKLKSAILSCVTAPGIPRLQMGLYWIILTNEMPSFHIPIMFKNWLDEKINLLGRWGKEDNDLAWIRS